MQIKLHGGPKMEVKDLRITFPTWLPKGPSNVTSARAFGIPQLSEDHMIMITEPDMVLTFECPEEMYAFADWIYTIRAQYSNLKGRVEIAMIKEEME